MPSDSFWVDFPCKPGTALPLHTNPHFCEKSGPELVDVTLKGKSWPQRCQCQQSSQTFLLHLWHLCFSVVLSSVLHVWFILIYFEIHMLVLLVWWVRSSTGILPCYLRVWLLFQKLFKRCHRTHSLCFYSHTVHSAKGLAIHLYLAITYAKIFHKLKYAVV